MNYPFDIKKIICSYISLHDRLGFVFLDKNLEKQLLQPRDKNGRALKMTSYYYLPKKICGLRQFGHKQNFYFLRRSKLDFQFIVKLVSFESSIYCHIDMFPQFTSTEKLKSIMMHTDLLSVLNLYKTQYWSSQSTTQVSITWCYKVPLGYNLPSEKIYQNYPAKMKQEAWDIICNLIQKSQKLKQLPPNT
jgi:hypothetical protein